MMVAIMMVSVCSIIGTADMNGAEPPEDAVSWDGTATTDWGGSGTQDDPYIIDTAEDLAGLAKCVAENTLNSDKFFKLTVNINLSDHSWNPIGKYDVTETTDPTTGEVSKETDAAYFYGTFDGNNKTIYGMTVSGAQSAGLFGALNSATIQNLTISNADVDATTYASAIAGLMTGTTEIIGCKIINSNIASTGSYAGGIGGVVYGTQITECSVSNSTIGSANYAAPMVGLLSSKSSITGSHSDSNTLSGKTVGGIAGNTYESVSITNSYINGLTIQSATKAGHIAGNPVKELTLTNTTYLGTIEWTGDFIDDGSFPAIVSTTDATSEYTYYFGEIQNALNASSEKSTLTLIKDAIIAGNQTVPTDTKLIITDSMTVEEGAVLKFESKDSIPDTGSFIIDGFVELNYTDAKSTDIQNAYGYGNVMVDGVAYEPGTETIDSNAADIRWYDSSKSEFTLNSATELIGFATLVNNGNTFSGKTVNLGGNIDLKGIEWTLIGTIIKDGAHNAFSGTFDGKNHTVSNISTNIQDGRAVGLFGYMTKGTIQNTIVDGASVSGSYAAGALVGFADVSSSKIANCSVINSNVSTSGSYAGGLVGQGYYLKMTGSHVSNSSIESIDRMGGIIGLSYSGTEVENCYAKDVDISGKYGAGLIGQIGSDCVITKSYVDGVDVIKGAVVYPTVYNGSLSDVPTVTYRNLDPDFRFSEDGTKNAIIEVKEEGHTYYYGSIDSYLETYPTEVTLIDGAVVNEREDAITLSVPLKITNARIEFGTSIEFENNSMLPDSGTLTVDGAILIQTVPSSVSCDLVGEGFIVSAEGDDIVAYGLDLEPLDADLSWMNQIPEGSEIILDSAADLRGLELIVNHFGFDFVNYNFILNADIDLDGKDWDPIGKGTYPFSSTDTPFNGTFDGNGFTISNLNVNLPEESMVGLFGLVREGTLTNITLENANVVGEDFVGGIVGWYGNAYPDRYSAAGTLSGCTVIGDIDINGRSTVGGVVGELITDASDNRVDANAGGNVIGTGDNIGGFAGYVQRHDSSEGSIDEANVDRIDVSGLTVQGSGEVGGVIGSVTSHIVFTECSAANMTIEAIEGDQEDFYMEGIGGLFGTIRGKGTSVSGCSVENTQLIPNGQPAGYITGVPLKDTVFENVSYSDDCSGSNTEDPSGTIVIPGSNDDEQTPSDPSWDDEELPPFIPSQDSDDDTVTIVACAAAAVVAALMAVFLILTYRKD